MFTKKTSDTFMTKFPSFWLPQNKKNYQMTQNI